MNDDQKVYRLPDITYQAPNLEVADPPPDLPYAQHEDFSYRELLKANAIPVTEEAVTEALATQIGVLLHAAAHTAGAEGYQAAVPRLEQLTGGSDDQAAVEAAYALVRLGHPQAREVLRRALAGPVDVTLGPVLAAGYLAMLGDPSGYPVIAQGLESQYLPTRMLACKQILFFMDFQGQATGSGEPVDALGLFRRALDDPNPSVAWRALEQIRALDPATIRELLTGRVDRISDPPLRRFAERVLQEAG